MNTHTWDDYSSAAGTSNLSSVTWTAPSDEIYNFSGDVWHAVQIGRSADVFVHVNGGAPLTSVSLFDGDAYSRASPFTFAETGVSLSAGDTIEVRFVTTSKYGTHVGVNLTVSSVSVIPEPSTLIIWPLLALCGFGIGWYRRRNEALASPAVRPERAT